MSALDNSQSLLVMIYHLGTEFDGPGIMPHAWESEGLTKLIADQIAENRRTLDGVLAASTLASKDPVMDYVVNGGDELAKIKAELAYALGALEREIAIGEQTAKELEAANAAHRAMAKQLADSGRLVEGMSSSADIHQCHRTITDDQNSLDLLPCPFCCGEARFIDHRETGDGYSVRCDHCAFMFPAWEKITSKRQLAARWNTRASGARSIPSTDGERHV